jgi:hypothetical protein
VAPEPARFKPAAACPVQRRNRVRVQVASRQRLAGTALVGSSVDSLRPLGVAEGDARAAGALELLNLDTVAETNFHPVDAQPLRPVSDHRRPAIKVHFEHATWQDFSNDPRRRLGRSVGRQAHQPLPTVARRWRIST